MLLSDPMCFNDTYVLKWFKSSTVDKSMQHLKVLPPPLLPGPILVLQERRLLHLPAVVRRRLQLVRPDPVRVHVPIPVQHAVHAPPGHCLRAAGAELLGPGAGGQSEAVQVSFRGSRVVNKIYCFAMFKSILDKELSL